MAHPELWCGEQRIAAEVREARSVWTRAIGLMGCSSWPRGVALKFSPCRAIHTWFVRFPLDVIFTDDAGQIVRIVRNLKPWRMAWAPRPACVVYEWSAGSLPPDGLRTGDRVGSGMERISL